MNVQLLFQTFDLRIGRQSASKCTAIDIYLAWATTEVPAPGGKWTAVHTVGTGICGYSVGMDASNPIDDWWCSTVRLLMYVGVVELKNIRLENWEAKCLEVYGDWHVLGMGNYGSTCTWGEMNCGTYRWYGHLRVLRRYGCVQPYWWLMIQYSKIVDVCGSCGVIEESSPLRGGFVSPLIRDLEYRVLTGQSAGYVTVVD